MVKKFKGGVGSIRDLAIHPTQNILASVSLDRYLRIYDLNEG